jgi:hypothetical protein
MVMSSTRPGRAMVMAAVIVAGAVALGVLGGVSGAAFFDTTANTANTLAAGTWIDFEGTLGSVTCGGSSSQVTVPAGGVPVGRTLVVRVGFRGTGGTVSATDSAGNTYTTDLDHSDNGQRSVILSAEITTALSAGDTITVTHPDENAEAVSVHRFIGLAGSGRVVETNTAGGTGGSPSVSVTTGGRRLVFAAAAQQNNGSVSIPAGWTDLASNGSISCGASATAKMTDVGAFRIEDAGSWTFNPTTGAGSSWAATIVGYQEP